MSINRRDLLRTAAAATVAHAAHSIPMLNAIALPTPPPRMAKFNVGVRIFFEGAWLFLPGPTNSNTMRAVTLDMPAPAAHHFPFGVWNTNWDDGKMPQLPPYSGSIPTVTFKTPGALPKDLGTLYANAQKDSPFYYIPNPDPQNPYKLNWNAQGLRVISIPIPTQIVPASFRTNAYIQDTGNHLHQAANPWAINGVPTTHIFDYQNADSLTFSLDPSTMSAPVRKTQDSTADYHFHTAPQKTDTTEHGPMMLSMLLGLIDPTLAADVTLQLIANPTIGPDVPTSVGPGEFELPVVAPKQISIPTCGSGGIAVGP